MNLIKLSVLLVTVLVCHGCIRSLNPLYTEETAEFDPALVGTWLSSDDGTGESWAFAAEKGTRYRLTHTDSEGHTAIFQACLVKLGEARFLDFLPLEVPENDNDFYQWHLLPTHSFVRVKQIEPTLQMSFPAGSWLEARLKADPHALQHAVMEGDLVLTAPTAELQAFWKKHAGDDEAFEDPSDMKKRVPAVE